MMRLALIAWYDKIIGDGRRNLNSVERNIHSLLAV